MKKFIFLFSMIAVMSACGNQSNSSNETLVSTDSITIVDSTEINDTVIIDTLFCDSIQ